MQAHQCAEEDIVTQVRFRSDHAPTDVVSDHVFMDGISLHVLVEIGPDVLGKLSRSRPREMRRHGSELVASKIAR